MLSEVNNAKAAGTKSLREMVDFFDVFAVVRIDEPLLGKGELLSCLRFHL